MDDLMGEDYSIVPHWHLRLHWVGVCLEFDMS
jgi:hypothetical protein